MNLLFAQYPDSYHALLSYLRLSLVQVNERTGARVAVMRGGFSFNVDLQDGYIPVTSTRRLHPRTAAAEVAWFAQGTNDVNFMRQYAPIWDEFVEDDGMTVRGAYGHRWRSAFGRDQLGLAVEALRLNPSDRRVVVSAWDPAEDGLGAPGQRNVPCPAMFSLSILGNELHCSLFIRSSDVFVGLPYDVMGQALLMQAIANSLSSSDRLIKPGVLHVTLGHPHLYEAHWELADECSERFRDVDPEFRRGPAMPTTYTLEGIERDPHGYVDLVSTMAKARRWPDFNPRPELVI